MASPSRSPDLWRHPRRDEPVGKPAGRGGEGGGSGKGKQAAGAGSSTDPAPPTPPAVPADWDQQSYAPHRWGDEAARAGTPAWWEQSGWDDTEHAGAPAEREWTSAEWNAWTYGHLWAPSKSITPPDVSEPWRYHWKDGSWWGKSHKQGPREGGYVPDKGKHTEQNLRREERKKASLQRRWDEDVEDPVGAPARAEARRVQRMEEEAVGLLRQNYTQAMIRAMQGEDVFGRNPSLLERAVRGGPNDPSKGQGKRK